MCVTQGTVQYSTVQSRYYNDSNKYLYCIYDLICIEIPVPSDLRNTGTVHVQELFIELRGM